MVLSVNIIYHKCINKGSNVIMHAARPTDGLRHTSSRECVFRYSLYCLFMPTTHLAAHHAFAPTSNNCSRCASCVRLQRPTSQPPLRNTLATTLCCCTDASSAATVRVAGFSDRAPCTTIIMPCCTMPSKHGVVTRVPAHAIGGDTHAGGPAVSWYRECAAHWGVSAAVGPATAGCRPRRACA